MNIKLLFSLTILIISNIGLAQNISSYCERDYVELVSCIDFSDSPNEYKFNLEFNPDGFESTEAHKNKRSETQLNKSNKGGLSPLDVNTSFGQNYGHGYAYGLVSIFDAYKKLDFKTDQHNQKIKDILYSIKSRVSRIESESKKEVQRAKNSIPALLAKINNFSEMQSLESNNLTSQYKDLISSSQSLNSSVDTHESATYESNLANTTEFYESSLFDNEFTAEAANIKLSLEEEQQSLIDEFDNVICSTQEQTNKLNFAKGQLSKNKGDTNNKSNFLSYYDSAIAITLECENKVSSSDYEEDPKFTEEYSFDSKDKVLSIKREKLKTYKSTNLSEDTTYNIYKVSGELQQTSREKFENGDNESALISQTYATALVNFGLDLVPVVSDAKGIYEAIVGENPLTGETLSTTDRVISATASVVGVLSFGTLGVATKLALKSGKLFSNGSKVRKIFSGAADIISSAQRLGLKTVAGTKVYAKIHRPLQSLPNGLKVKRIREGVDSTKIAVIGRKMPGVVNDTATHLRKGGANIEIFGPGAHEYSPKSWDQFKLHQKEYNIKNKLDPKTYLPHNEVVKTQMYKNNKVWAQKLKDEGYTVIDIGDPFGATYGVSGGLTAEGMSTFYSIEKKILFGDLQ